MAPRPRTGAKPRPAPKKTLHDLFNAVAALKLHAHAVERSACASCRRKQHESFAAIDRLVEEAVGYCNALSAKPRTR
jgi:hypothetical protein